MPVCVAVVRCDQHTGTVCTCLCVCLMGGDSGPPPKYSQDTVTVFAPHKQHLYGPWKLHNHPIRFAWFPRVQYLGSVR